MPPEAAPVSGPTGPPAASVPSASPAPASSAPVPSGAPAPAAGPPSPASERTSPASESRPAETLSAEARADYEAYRQLGFTPGQMQQIVPWAREIAQQIRDGRLGPPTPAPTAAPRAEDPLGKDYDELDARAQAARLREWIRSDLQHAVFEPERDALRQQLTQHQQQVGNQMNLLQHVLQLAVSNPGIPLPTIVERATRMATMSPQDLLQQALNAELEPAQRQRDIDQAVEARLATLKQEEENRRAEALNARVRVPRMIAAAGDKTTSPFERATQRRQAVAALIRKQLAGGGGTEG